MDTAQRYASNAIENVKALPSAIGKAWTGEGKQVEFPDAKEITDIPDVGFWESFWPNIKAGLTVDPKEKAGVYANSFDGDSRFGGAGEDAHGNPYLVWSGKPYYINAPGMSATDATDIVAQIAQLLPASKYAGKGLSLTSRAARGAPAYAATNVAQQYGTMAAGGKDKVDLGEAGAAGAIGGAAEAVIPPVAKAMGRVLAPARPAVPERLQMLARALKGEQSQGGIPMTRGQTSGDINIIRREEAMRHGAEGDLASAVMRRFDDQQTEAIRNQAMSLEGRLGAGVGNKESSITDIGSRIKEDLITARDSSKEAVREAYKKAADTKAALNPEVATDMATEMLRVPREMNLFTTDGMNQLNAALRTLKSFTGLGGQAKLKPADIQMIERFRQGLNTAISGTQGTEQAALVRMKSVLDRRLNVAIDNGLLTGDPEALALLRQARDLRRIHAERFEAGKGDRTGNALLKILDENGATPVQAINYIVNTGKASGQDVALGMVRRLKNIFGPDSEQIRLIKSAYLLRAFATARNGERVIDRRSLVTNAREMMAGDGKVVANELFTPAEREAVVNVTNEVSRTITPADAQNPSRSAWAFVQALMDRGLISSSLSSLRHVPFLDGVGNAARSVSGGLAAGHMVNPSHLPAVPALTAGSAAIGNAIRESR
jgi:hypothetical protein